MNFAPGQVWVALASRKSLPATLKCAPRCTRGLVRSYDGVS